VPATDIDTTGTEGLSLTAVIKIAISWPGWQTGDTPHERTPAKPDTDIYALATMEVN